MAADFTLKYNSATVHIGGLAIRSEGSEFDYAITACPALSRSVRFAESATQAATAAEVIKEARSLAVAIGKRLCKKCLEAAEAMAQAEAEAAAPAATGRALRPSQGVSAVGAPWDLLYDKPRQGAQVVRNGSVYALVCVEHLTVHRLTRLSDERAVRKAGGWCPSCQH